MRAASSISEAESLVMEVPWRSGRPISCEEVVQVLAEPRQWREATVKTLLNRLLRKGAIKATRDIRRIYSIDPRGFQELQRWLNRYRAFWEGRLDALECALLDDARGSTPEAQSVSARMKRISRRRAKPRRARP